MWRRLPLATRFGYRGSAARRGIRWCVLGLLGVLFALLLSGAQPLAFTAHWIAQCGAPLLPLDEATLIAGLGDSAFRRTSFDCTQAWLYPDGGTTSGIYGLDRSLMQESRLCLPGLLLCAPAPDDPFISGVVLP